MKVFISYSTKDLQDVQTLQASLADSPIELLVAENSIVPSESLPEKIKTQIQTCDLFVVVWSSHAKSSDWVSQEVGQAVALDKTILPIILDDCEQLPGFMSGLKYISAAKNKKQAIQQVQSIIMSKYEQRIKEQNEAQRRKSESETKFLLGAGALALWLFSK